MPNNLNDSRTDLPVEAQYSQHNQPVQARQLDKSQKIAVAVLAFFAILVIFVWIAQTKQSLSNPLNNSNTVKQSSTCPDGNCGSSSDTDLRLKDTDGDGLNDYDELHTYNTSPYLKDSDSDGYSDKQEIESKNDPNCPVGQQCDVTPTMPVKPVGDSLLPAKLQTPTGMSDNTGKVNLQLDSAKTLLSGQEDATTLRAVLIESGMDPQALKQVSDEELMHSYQDILSNSANK